MTLPFLLFLPSQLMDVNDLADGNAPIDMLLMEWQSDGDDGNNGTEVNGSFGRVLAKVLACRLCVSPPGSTFSDTCCCSDD